MDDTSTALFLQAREEYCRFHYKFYRNTPEKQLTEIPALEKKAYHAANLCNTYEEFSQWFSSCFEEYRDRVIAQRDRKLIEDYVSGGLEGDFHKGSLDIEDFLESEITKLTKRIREKVLEQKAKRKLVMPDIATIFDELVVEGFFKKQLTSTSPEGDIVRYIPSFSLSQFRYAFGILSRTIPTDLLSTFGIDTEINEKYCFVLLAKTGKLKKLKGTLDHNWPLFSLLRKKNVTFKEIPSIIVVGFNDVKYKKACAELLDRYKCNLQQKRKEKSQLFPHPERQGEYISAKDYMLEKGISERTAYRHLKS